MPLCAKAMHKVCLSSHRFADQAHVDSACITFIMQAARSQRTALFSWPKQEASNAALLILKGYFLALVAARATAAPLQKQRAGQQHNPDEQENPANEPTNKAQQSAQ